ncbi:MAG: hypothetical protein PVF27_07755, partial [Gemmatimonadales bacterium]
MALVRCPKHKIPYNDENPRGCPACAREKEGGGEADLMRELARMSRAVQAPPDIAEPPPGRAPPAPGAPPTARPVTEPPRRPVTEESALQRLAKRAKERKWLSGGVTLIAILLVGLVVASGPDFVAEPHPVRVPDDQLRPLPIDPGVPIENVFALLGPQAPQSAPESRRLARYAYGTDLTIDALNGVVYAITYSVPNRRWRGLQVGVPQRLVEGALALLGIPQVSEPTGSQLRRVGKYAVYPSLEQRPARTLRTEVRPPNGC